MLYNNNNIMTMSSNNVHYGITVINSLLQFISTGSGSHSPFPVPVDVLDPVSSSPGGQLKVTTLPLTIWL